MVLIKTNRIFINGVSNDCTYPCDLGYIEVRLIDR
jgi:hypothetical protein